MSTSVEKSITNILQTEVDFLTIYSVIDKQNTKDCDVYSIANAVSVLHGLDPRNVIYKYLRSWYLSYNPNS